jgi:membrane protease YdiL (CAAX protease family)
MGTGERWSKAVFFGIGWFILFVILQCVYMVYAFGLKVSLDPSYLLQVAQIFDGADLTDTEQYTETVTNLVYSLTTYLEVLLATGMVGLYIIDRQFHSTRFGIHAIKVWDIPQFVFIGIIINLLSTLFVSCFSQETLEETGYDTDSLMQGSFGGTLLAVGICAPICEEIAFRYFIYHNLARGNKIVAVIISAGLFGVAHGNLLQGMYAFAFGLIFAFADEDYNSLIPSIIMHMTVNSLSCLTLLCADDLEVMVLYGCALLLSLILTIIAYILKYIGTKRCVVAEIYNINYNTYEIMKKVIYSTIIVIQVTLHKLTQSK